MSDRNAKIQLTAADKQAAKAAYLDSSQGPTRRDGALWIILSVVRSHYGDDPKHLNDRDKIYRAGNGLAAWLGYDSWFDIVVAQNPEHIAELRHLIQTVR